MGSFSAWAKDRLFTFARLTPGRQLSLISIVTLLLFLPVAIWMVLQPTRLFPRAGPLVTPPGTPEGASAVLLIEPQKTLLAPGKEGTFSVNIDAGTHEVTAADVILTYDKNIVSVLEVVPGDFLPVRLGEISIDNNLGRVQFAAGEQPASIKKGGKGTLATLKIKSTGDIGSSLFEFADGTAVTAVGWETSVLSYALPGSVIVKEPEKPSVSIFFRLQGVTSPRANPIPITVWMRNLDNEAQSLKTEVSAVINAVGFANVIIPSISPGNYEAIIKSPSHLSKSLGQHTIPITGEYTIADNSSVPLFGGDVRPQARNDRISVADYSLVVSHFGNRMPSGGTAADIDFDGDVDIFDYNMVVSNFGKTGALYGEGAICPQVVTSARNSTTGECREFVTPCDIPEGWERVDTCPISSPTPTPTPLRIGFGKALRISASSQDTYITAPSFSVPIIDWGGLAVGVFIKPSFESLSGPNGYVILGKEFLSGEASGYRLSLVNKKVEFQIAQRQSSSTQPTYVLVRSLSTLEAERWYYISVTAVPGSALYLNINGVNEAVQGIGAIYDPSDRQLIMGCIRSKGSSGCSGQFYGILDEVVISQLGDNIIKPQLSPFTPSDRTVALYHLDGDALDASSHALNGQMVGNIEFINSNIIVTSQ